MAKLPLNTMIRILINWLISAVVIIIAAYVLPGVHVENFGTALLVALVLGILNAVLKPVLIILTLPITIITLGLFALVINALLILLVGAIIPGFTVDNFGWAILFSIVLTILGLLTARL